MLGTKNVYFPLRSEEQSKALRYLKRQVAFQQCSSMLLLKVCMAGVQTRTRTMWFHSELWKWAQKISVLKPVSFAVLRGAGWCCRCLLTFMCWRPWVTPAPRGNSWASTTNETAFFLTCATWVNPVLNSGLDGAFPLFPTLSVWRDLPAKNSCSCFPSSGVCKVPDFVL